MQQVLAPSLDQLLNDPIEMLFQFEVLDDNHKPTGKFENIWCKGVIKEICDSSDKKWIIGTRSNATKKYKKGEAAEVDWCATKYTEPETTIQAFKPKLWNGDVVHSWRKFYEDIQYEFECEE